MDGYQNDDLVKLNSIQKLYKEQLTINKKIEEICNEMDTIPELPKDLERWMGSLPDKDNPFKLEHYKKMSKISKKYINLIEEKDINSHKIKLMAIDNVIDKIKKIIEQ